MSRLLVLLPVVLSFVFLAPTNAGPMMKELMLDLEERFNSLISDSEEYTPTTTTTTTPTISTSEDLEDENDIELDQRIINGKHASKQAHPYIASLQKYSIYYKTWRHRCGGALIKDQWVLTAAHCLDYINLRNLKYYRVVLGEHSLKTEDETEDIKEIAEIIQHPAWDRNSIYHDIGLIKLKSKVVQSEAVKIIKMSDNDDAYVNNKCVIAGWGRIKSGDPNHDDNKKRATILQELHITNIPINECKTWAEEFKNSWLPRVTKDNICVQSRSNVTEGGACHGDSGGPLICGDNHDKLAGITSWGHPLCSRTPSVYTRVSSYLDWIEKVTTDDALESEKLQLMTRLSKLLEKTL